MVCVSAVWLYDVWSVFQLYGCMMYGVCFSCLDDELGSVSGDGGRAGGLSRQEVVAWYQQHQLPRGAGVDALTGRAAPWFHGERTDRGPR